MSPRGSLRRRWQPSKALHPAELPELNTASHTVNDDLRYCTECLVAGHDIPRIKLREALMGLGNVFAKRGAEEKALAYYEKVITISKHPFKALTSASNIYRKRKEYEKAMIHYDRVLEMDPRNSHAWHGKADCHRGKKEHDDALKAWEKALTYGMEPRVVLTRIGDAYRSLDNFEKAEDNYQKALQYGYDKYAHMGMAKICSMKGKVDEALKIFAMLSEMEPNDPRIDRPGQRPSSAPWQTEGGWTPPAPLHRCVAPRTTAFVEERCTPRSHR